MFSVVNSTTGWWFSPFFTIYGCASKRTSVDALSTSFFLYNYLDFLYSKSMSHSHTTLAVWCHITNSYWNSSARHLCTTWSTLAYDSNNCYSPLQSDRTVNSDPHKYFLKFPMYHLTAAVYPTKLCLDFYTDKTVDIEIKYIGRRRITSRDLSN